MEKLIRYLGKLDWVVALGTLAWGLYTQSSWIIGAGVFSVFMAWYKPADRIKARLEKLIVRKKAKTTDDSGQTLSEDAFYAQMLGKAPTTAAPAQAPAPAQTGPIRFDKGFDRYGMAYLSGSIHNQVQRDHLNLSQTRLSEKTPTDFC